jgi:hypothetical protein
MYDFWFTLGTAIIDPSLLTTVKPVALGPPAVFTTISQRTITEPDTRFSFTNTKTAGLLDADQTPLARAAIRSFIQHNPAAPPVSIYTAGRFCQLLLVDEIGFADIIDAAHNAYTDAVKGYTGSFPPAFAAVLGLCLIDENLLKFIIKDTGQQSPDQQLISFMGEFGMNPDRTSPERSVLNTFAKDSRFQKAAHTLMTGPTWQELCGDQFFFWGQNARAVL